MNFTNTSVGAKSFPFVEAIYREESLKAFKDNPFICALPPIPDNATLRKSLNVLPRFSEDERDLPAAQRIQLLGQLRKVFIALPRVVDLARAVLTMLHAGYEHRRPYSEEDGASLQDLYRAQMTGQFASVQQNDMAYQISMALVGMSGSGKSFALRHITGLLPQVIYHPELGKWQLPFLYVEMAYDGKSAHTMASAIIEELDRLLPDANYAEMYKRVGNAEQRLAKVLKAARNHGLGMLIIDESQNQTRKGRTKGDDPAPLAKLLITACNTAKVPVLFAGTPELVELLGPRFTRARRMSGDGSSCWENFKRSQHGEVGEFETVLKILLKYQWVQQPATYSEELADCFFEYTQGVPDMMVKLWRSAQEVAIGGSETVDQTAIAAAFEKQFEMAKHGLLSLKHRDRLVSHTVTDLISKPVDVAELCHTEFLAPQPLEPIGTKKRSPAALAKPKATSSKASGKAHKPELPSPKPAVIAGDVAAAADLRGVRFERCELPIARVDDLLS